MSANFSTMAIGVALCAMACPAGAGDWKHEFAPYLWASGMSGTAGVGSITAETDLSFSDILENLEMGFMGMYRASKDRHSITVDAIYMGLGATETGPNGLLKADIDMDQVGLEVDYGYMLGESFTILGGVRYVDLETRVEVGSPLGNLSAREKQSWVDPVIGAQYSWRLSDQWSLTLRGDIGGFGIGSDFSWHGVATLRWQLSPRTGVGFAYRYLDIDYEDGTGDDYFKYDMATSGPAIGVVFTF